jgi:hypothetical protein
MAYGHNPPCAYKAGRQIKKRAALRFGGAALFFGIMRKLHSHNCCAAPSIPLRLPEPAASIRTLLYIEGIALRFITVSTFMHSWNDFLGPLIYLQSDGVRTLSLGLYSFQGEYVSQWHYLMAASILLMLPCLFVFFLFQHYFIEGTTVTGIKG